MNCKSDLSQNMQTDSNLTLRLSVGCIVSVTEARKSSKRLHWLLLNKVGRLGIFHANVWIRLKTSESTQKEYTSIHSSVSAKYRGTTQSFHLQFSQTFSGSLKRMDIHRVFLTFTKRFPDLKTKNRGFLARES
ncbi:MAG: hypothetical protein OXE59_05885 [Bacteroidetes bacterium]|nr:hypothetical protein [Bacteroidota bacterium]